MTEYKLKSLLQEICITLKMRAGGSIGVCLGSNSPQGKLWISHLQKLSESLL